MAQSKDTDLNRFTMSGMKLLVTSLVLVIISLVLQIVGFVTPGWEVFRYSNQDSLGIPFTVNRHYGLWYTCTGAGCESGRVDEPSMYRNSFKISPHIIFYLFYQLLFHMFALFIHLCRYVFNH